MLFNAVNGNGTCGSQFCALQGATQLGRVTYYAGLRHDLRSITRQHERDRC
jgi:hypothetical protein